MCNIHLSGVRAWAYKYIYWHCILLHGLLSSSSLFAVEAKALFLVYYSAHMLINLLLYLVRFQDVKNYKFTHYCSCNNFSPQLLWWCSGSLQNRNITTINPALQCTLKLSWVNIDLETGQHKINSHFVCHKQMNTTKSIDTEPRKAVHKCTKFTFQLNIG